MGGKERQIAPQHDVRSQACVRGGARAVKQVAKEQFESSSSLSEWALVERGQNLAGFDIRKQFGKQIGCDDFDLTKKAFFFQGREDGDAVGRTDIDARWVGLSRKQ